MRRGFETAMHALTQIRHDDRRLEETVNCNKEEYEKQLADLLKMLLTLKVSHTP